MNQQVINIGVVWLLLSAFWAWSAYMVFRAHYPKQMAVKNALAAGAVIGLLCVWFMLWANAISVDI